MNNEEYINLLTKQFVEYKNIDLAIVYGSVLTKNFNDNSDIDIAVVSYKPLSLSFMFELKKDLELLCKREVDLFDLSIDEGLINYKIITEGFVIKKDVSLFVKYHLKSLLFYEDYFKLYKFMQDKHIRSFLNG